MAAGADEHAYMYMAEAALGRHGLGEYLAVLPTRDAQLRAVLDAAGGGGGRSMERMRSVQHEQREHQRDMDEQDQEPSAGPVGPPHRARSTDGPTIPLGRLGSSNEPRASSRKRSATVAALEQPALPIPPQAQPKAVAAGGEDDTEPVKRIKVSPSPS